MRPISFRCNENNDDAGFTCDSSLQGCSTEFPHTAHKNARAYTFVASRFWLGCDGFGTCGKPRDRFGKRWGTTAGTSCSTSTILAGARGVSVFLWARRFNNLTSDLRESVAEHDGKLVHGGLPIKGGAHGFVQHVP